MGGVKPPHLGGCNIQRGFHPHIWGAAPHGGGFTLQRAFCPLGVFCPPTCGDFPPCLGGLWSSKGGFHPPGGVSPPSVGLSVISPHIWGLCTSWGGSPPMCGAFPSLPLQRGPSVPKGGAFTPHMWAFLPP